MAFIIASKLVAEASKRTCCLYRTEYISRNELFRHLNDGCMTGTPPAALIVANVAVAAPPPKAASLPVLEEPKFPETISVPIGGFI